MCVSLLQDTVKGHCEWILPPACVLLKDTVLVIISSVHVLSVCMQM